MIDFQNEQLAPLSKAARWVPPVRGEKPPHPSCLWRWAQHGVRGVRLEVVRVGGTICTSREALQRFIERTTTGEALPAKRPGRAHEAAKRQLQKLGF